MTQEFEEKIEAELRAIRALVSRGGNTLTPRAVTRLEAAKLLSVSPSHVSRMLKRGELLAANVGGVPRIPMSEIDRMTEARPAPLKSVATKTPKPPRVPKGTPPSLEAELRELAELRSKRKR